VTDIAVEKILQLGLTLTKSRYRLFAFWDADYRIGPEERCELPADYDLWPETDSGYVN
jgi:hypothetical protein